MKKYSNIVLINNNNMTCLVFTKCLTENDIMKIALDDNYSLSFCNCNIGKNGIYILGTLLSTTETLKKLSILDDNLTRKEIKILADGIKLNNTLEYLDLTNSISVEDYLDKIIESLEINKSITFVNLSRNYLYNYSFLLLNNLIKKNTTITTLILNNVTYCELSYYGRTHFIIDGVKNSKTLKVLDLSYNYFDDNIEVAFSDMIKENKSLTNLNLTFTYLTKDMIDIILDNMKYNTQISITL